MTGLLTFWLAPTQAALLNVSPQRMRGTIVLLAMICQILICLGLAPPAVGLLNDLLTPRYGAAAIRYSILAMTAAILLAGLAALRVRAALAQKEEPSR